MQAGDPVEPKLLLATQPGEPGIKCRLRLGMQVFLTRLDAAGEWRNDRDVIRPPLYSPLLWAFKM